MISEHCNFNVKVIDVEAPAVDGEFVTEQLRIHLEIEISNGRREQVYVPLKNLDKLDLEKCTSGCVYANASAKKKVRAAIREQVMRMLAVEPKRFYAKETGWFLDTRAYYVAGAEILPCIPENQGITPSDMLLYRFSGKSESSGEETTIQLLKSLIKERVNALYVFSYTLASFLRSRWAEAGLPFLSGLLIIGRSGVGKTRLANNLCMLLDDAEGMPAHVTSTDSTISVLRKILAEARDQVVLCDDVSKNTIGKSMSQRFDLAIEALRFSCSEAGREKSVNGGTAKVVSRGSLVITSEMLPMQISELTRCVIVHLKKPHSGGADGLRDLASIALSAYLSWFAENYEAEMSFMRAFAANPSAPEYPDEERLCIAIGQLKWCFLSFLRFAKNTMTSTIILGSDPEKTIESYFGRLLDEEIKLIHMCQPQTAIQRCVHKIYEENLLGGKKHKNFYCVKYEPLIQFIQQQAEDSCVVFSEREISTALKRSGLVSIDKSGKLTKKYQGERRVFLDLSKIDRL